MRRARDLMRMKRKRKVSLPVKKKKKPSIHPDIWMLPERSLLEQT